MHTPFWPLSLLLEIISLRHGVPALLVLMNRGVVQKDVVFDEKLGKNLVNWSVESMCSECGELCRIPVDRQPDVDELYGLELADCHKCGSKVLSIRDYAYTKDLQRREVYDEEHRLKGAYWVWEVNCPQCCKTLLVFYDEMPNYESLFLRSAPLCEDCREITSEQADRLYKLHVTEEKAPDSEFGLLMTHWVVESACIGCGETKHTRMEKKPAKDDIWDIISHTCEECTRRYE